MELLVESTMLAYDDDRRISIRNERAVKEMHRRVNTHVGHVADACAIKLLSIGMAFFHRSRFLYINGAYYAVFTTGALVIIVL